MVNQIKKFNVKEMPRLTFDKSLPDLISASAKIMGGSPASPRTNEALRFVLRREEQTAGVRHHH